MIVERTFSCGCTKVSVQLLRTGAMEFLFAIAIEIELPNIASTIVF